MEAVRAGSAEVTLLALNRDTNRTSIVWMYIVGIKPERTDSAILGANSTWFASLKGAWLWNPFFLRFNRMLKNPDRPMPMR